MKTVFELVAGAALVAGWLWIALLSDAAVDHHTSAGVDAAAAVAEHGAAIRVAVRDALGRTPRAAPADGVVVH